MNTYYLIRSFFLPAPVPLPNPVPLPKPRVEPYTSELCIVLSCLVLSDG